MGKRQSRRPTVSTVAGNSEPLLHVRDDANRLTWLVDGGASLTLVPPTPEERAKGPASTPLHAANGTPINCYGTRQMTLSLGSRLFDWEIVVADVATPLIGADFLMEYHLAADHTLGLLVDLDDFSRLPTTHQLDKQRLHTITRRAPRTHDTVVQPRENKARCGAPHSDGRPARLRTRPSDGTRSTRRIKSRIRQTTEARDRATIKKRLGLSSSSSPETGWLNKTLRRLPTSKHYHKRRQISNTPHIRLQRGYCRKNDILEDRPLQRLSPDPGCTS